MSRDNRLPLWLPLLIANVESCGIRRGVHHIEVRHDDNCAHWDGRTCDCEPVIETGERVDWKYRNGGEG